MMLIAAGTLLLGLPVSASDGVSIGWFDSLFTASSAVCVTGLSVIDPGTALSPFGQLVLLVLIQSGGLGCMACATMVMIALGRRITLRDRVLIRESINAVSLSGLVRLTLVYGATAMVIEAVGATLLAVRFVPQFGVSRGCWVALFHAVSAFCNAGFDLLGTSLTEYRCDAYVLLVHSGLIILGGVGFSVLSELMHKRFRWRRLTLHARLVLIVSASLLLCGTALFALLEWDNPATLGGCGAPGEKLLNAFFQSVTMRTAGFASIDQSAQRDASKLVSILLMFIGASPASTGGGMKTTTVSILFLILWSVVRGRRDVTVLGRRLPADVMRRAIAMLMIAVTVLLAGTLLLTIIEHDRFPLIDLLFESASALSTAGVSAVGTPLLKPAGQVLLIPMMLFGRVGVLSLAMALAGRQETYTRLRYPEESIMIG